MHWWNSFPKFSWWFGATLISLAPNAKRRSAFFLAFNTAGFLGENSARILTFRRLGVRIMQLTYNNRGVFGDGCLEPGNAGLSKAGHQAIRTMNEIGVAVDLSHSGYRTT